MNSQRAQSWVEAHSSHSDARHRADAEPLPAVFVLEPHMCAAAALVAEWDPVATVQLPNVTRCPDQLGVRGSLLHAIEVMGARTLVMCGEGAGPPSYGGGVEHVFTGCQALLDDECMGPLLSCGAVVLEVLWFDTRGDGLHRWNPAGGGFKLLSAASTAELVAELRSR
ncbi:MAG: hypothetical protein JNK82_07395 [Myxococcaceae bacterium]|nr:hypothetical protein [Myxococcaceae bacterium]